MTTPRIHFRSHSSRSGITLVELLVVIGILLLLLVTVAPNLAPTPEQKGREAAATVISMINRAQKRAVDQKADAGLWLEPLITSGSVRVVSPKAYVQLDGATVSMASLDMFASEPQDAYNGDDPDAAKALVYPVNSSGNVFVPGFRSDECLVLFEERSCAFIRDLCSESSRITIAGLGYEFRLLSDKEQRTLSTNYFPTPYRPSPSYPGNVNPNPPSDGLHALVVGWIRSDDGGPPGTGGVDPWTPSCTPASPEFPVSSHGQKFAIQRPNTRTATPPLSVPAGFAIDVAWSSYGTLLLHNSVDANRLGNGSNMQLIDNLLANQPVQIMFDMNNALKNLVVRKFVAGFGVGSGAVVDQTLTLNVDLFLLVGRADRVGRPYVKNPTEANPGANWQYPDSRWIKISCVTGKTLIADPYLGVDNVYDSQAYARSDIAAVRN